MGNDELVVRVGNLSVVWLEIVEEVEKGGRVGLEVGKVKRVDLFFEGGCV